MVLGDSNDKDYIKMYTLNETLREQIVQTLSQFPHPIQYLIISGDIAHINGFASNDAHTKAVEWIKTIQQICKIPSENIIVCPGNHDQDFGALHNKSTHHLYLDNVPLSDIFFKQIQQKNSFHIDCYAKYIDFCKALDAVCEDRSTDWNHLHCVIERDHIRFVILNTTWLNGHDPDYFREIGNSKLKKSDTLYYKLESRSKLKVAIDALEGLRLNNDKFNVLIMHHPADYLRKEQRFYLKDQSNLFAQVRQNADLVLFGHTHPKTSSEIPPTQYEYKHFSAAGALYYDPSYENQPFFHVLEVDLEKKEVNKNIFEFINDKDDFTVSNNEFSAKVVNRLSVPKTDIEENTDIPKACIEQYLLHKEYPIAELAPSIPQYQQIDLPDAWERSNTFDILLKSLHPLKKNEYQFIDLLLFDQLEGSKNFTDLMNASSLENLFEFQTISAKRQALQTQRNSITKDFKFSYTVWLYDADYLRVEGAMEKALYRNYYYYHHPSGDIKSPKLNVWLNLVSNTMHDQGAPFFKDIQSNYPNVIKALQSLGATQHTIDKRLSFKIDVIDFDRIGNYWANFFTK